MDVSEVDNAADGSLVSEALTLVWGMLDDMLDAPGFDRSEYEDSLARLAQLAGLLG